MQDVPVVAVGRNEIENFGDSISRSIHIYIDNYQLDVVKLVYHLAGNFEDQQGLL